MADKNVFQLTQDQYDRMAKSFETGEPVPEDILSYVKSTYKERFPGQLEALGEKRALNFIRPHWRRMVEKRKANEARREALDFIRPKWEQMVRENLFRQLEQIDQDMPLSRDELERSLDEASKWNFDGKAKQGKSQIVGPGEGQANEREITLEELKELSKKYDQR